jgi:hypothetical protein
MTRRLTTRRLAAGLLAAPLALAACADPQTPPPGPVGVAAEDLPPQTAAPEGLLGDAAVGADDLSDPGIDTLGDPFVP